MSDLKIVEAAKDWYFAKRQMLEPSASSSDNRNYSNRVALAEHRLQEAIRISIEIDRVKK